MHLPCLYPSALTHPRSHGFSHLWLPFVLTAFITAGAIILGMEEERHNWDKIGANMNNIRTKTLIKDAGRCGCGLQTAKQFTNFRMSKPATSRYRCGPVRTKM